MRFEAYEALSFDCYGTLIDWEAGILAVLRPWAARTGPPVADDDLLATFGAHESDHQRAEPGAAYPEILSRTMTSIGAALDRPVADADRERLAHSVPDWPAFADSADALARLATRYRLIILSNVDRASFGGSAERLGTTFAAVVTAQDVGAYKPDPRNFDALLSTTSGLGIRPGRLLHVAQSLYHDHIPARAAGLSTVRIDRPGDRPGPGATPPVVDAVVPDAVFPSMAAFADRAMATVLRRSRRYLSVVSSRSRKAATSRGFVR